MMTAAFDSNYVDKLYNVTIRCHIRNIYLSAFPFRVSRYLT